MSNVKSGESVNLLFAEVPSKSLLHTCRQVYYEARGIYRDAKLAYWRGHKFALETYDPSRYSRLRLPKTFDLAAIQLIKDRCSVRFGDEWTLCWRFNPSDGQRGYWEKVQVLKDKKDGLQRRADGDIQDWDIHNSDETCSYCGGGRSRWR